MIQSWKNRENITEVPYRNSIDRLKSDISAVGKYGSLMNDTQKINSHNALRKIMETLEGKGYHDEAGEIKDMSVILFSTPNSVSR
jgi:hypothetical protein